MAATGGVVGSGGVTGTGGVPGTDLPISVRTKGISNSGNMIAVYFDVQVVNNGTTALDLSSLSLKYWFTWDEAASSNPPTLQASCTYSLGVTGGSCTNVIESFATVSPARTGADHVFILDFASGTTLAGGATAEIGPGFEKSDFTSFDETNDYSNQTDTTAFEVTTTVTAYLGGALVYGSEPQ